MIVYNGEGHILGRLSSIVAKKLLEGETIEIVNIEKVVISGNRKDIIRHYKKRVDRGDPHKGPFFPRTPVGIFKRSVRGMLPMEKTKGKNAFRRLKAHIGVPERLKNNKHLSEGAADASKLMAKTIDLGKLSVSLGAKKRW